MADDDLPPLRSTAELDRMAGEQVRIEGDYVELGDARPAGRSRPTGGAAVRLADGELVLLEPSWSAAALRDPAERAALGGRRVEAVGIFYRSSPPPPGEEAAYITGRCLSPVERIGAVAGPR